MAKQDGIEQGFLGKLVEERDAKLNSLSAIVAKLPKCWRLDDIGVLAQDVSMTPGMEVFRLIRWFDDPAEIRAVSIVRFELRGGDWWVGSNHGGLDFLADECYLTREAAEAANP